MKKQFSLVLACLVLGCMVSFSAFGQVEPLEECGWSATGVGATGPVDPDPANPPGAGEVCSDGSNLADVAGTAGTIPAGNGPNYDFVLVDMQNLDANGNPLILEITPDGVPTVDLTTYAAGDQLCVVGFNYDLANLNAVLSALCDAGSCSQVESVVGLPAGTICDDGDPNTPAPGQLGLCQVVNGGNGTPPIPVTDLGDVINVLQVLTGSSASIETVDSLVEALNPLLPILGIPEICGAAEGTDPGGYYDYCLTIVDCVAPIACPVEVTVANDNATICDGGLGTEVADWQAAINAANPLDATQDPDAVGAIVYSSVLPVAGTTAPDNYLPDGVFNGINPCQAVPQTTSAYMYCDVDDDGTVNAGDTYTLISDFTLTVYAPMQPSVLNNDGACGPSITLACPNYTAANDYDANGDTPDFAAETGAGAVVFTVTHPGAPAGCDEEIVNATYDCVAAPTDPPYISEIHYDNSGADSNECIEVAVPNTFTGNLADCTVTLYNGSTGMSYDSQTLDNFTVGNNDGTNTYYVWCPASIQNGGPDGLSLDCIGQGVLEFWSYEGTFNATNGPANGMGSTDMGVSEDGTGGADESLENIGGVWQSPACNTMGDTNGTGGAPPCNPVCDIVTVVSNIVCDDNGTPNDPSDDTFTFDVTVTNTDATFTNFSDDQGNSGIAYGAVLSYGPFPADGTTTTINYTDDTDPNCVETADASSPACSTPPGCNADPGVWCPPGP